MFSMTHGKIQIKQLCPPNANFILSNLTRVGYDLDPLIWPVRFEKKK